MKAEHLKAWLQAATREKDPDTETWGKVVSGIQLAFWEGKSGGLDVDNHGTDT